MYSTYILTEYMSFYFIEDREYHERSRMIIKSSRVSQLQGGPAIITLIPWISIILLFFSFFSARYLLLFINSDSYFDF